jgi:hypothetical protein
VLDQRGELQAALGQQAPGLGVAVVDDAMNLAVDTLRRGFLRPQSNCQEGSADAASNSEKRFVQEPVELRASKAEIGLSEDSFCRVCRPIAQLWDKKTVKNRPLRSICSRRFPSPTGSWPLSHLHKQLYIQ